MIGQMHAGIACLQSHAVLSPSPNFLITNGCFNPINVSSHCSIAQLSGPTKQPVSCSCNMRLQAHILSAGISATSFDTSNTAIYGDFALLYAWQSLCLVQDSCQLTLQGN